MRVLLVSFAVTVTAAVSVTRAAEPLVILSPEIATVRVVDRQTIELLTTVERQVTRTITAAPPAAVTFKVTQGEIKPTPTTEVGTVIEQVITRLPIDQVMVHRINGQKIPTEKFADEFRQPAAVIMLRADQRLAPTCAKLFKPEALVLQLSVSKAPPIVAPSQGPVRVYPPMPVVPR